MAEHPDAKVALDQLAYARGWFATYNTVAVRKALEDGVQAVLSGKTTPEDGDGDGAAAGGCADEAVCGSDGAEAAGVAAFRFAPVASRSDADCPQGPYPVGSNSSFLTRHGPAHRGRLIQLGAASNPRKNRG